MYVISHNYISAVTFWHHFICFNIFFLAAFRAKLKRITVNVNGETVLKFKVLRKIFKSNRRGVPKTHFKTAKIWRKTTCNCQQLEAGKVYLMAGHYDKVTKRLALNDNGWIGKWKRGLYRQIKNWQKRRRRRQNTLSNNRTKKGVQSSRFCSYAWKFLHGSVGFSAKHARK